jgi:hypothetical protein
MKYKKPMTQVIPLSVPDALLVEIRDTAKQTHLSVQDVLRQSAKLGMPKLRELAVARRDGLAPLSDEALAAAYAKMSEADIEEDRELGKASIAAQKRERK